MARYLIRHPFTGEERTVGEGALPYFPDFEVVGDAPAGPLVQRAVVVIHGGDADTARPDTDNPVIWYGSVEPTNADNALDVWAPATDGS